MESNSIDNKEKVNSKLKLYIPIILYFLIMFLFGVVFIILMIYITSKIYDANTHECLKGIYTADYEYIKGTKEYKAYYCGYALGQALIYLLLFLIFIFSFKEYLIEDFKKLKERKLYFTIYIIISIILFLIASTIASNIVSKYTDDSENQKLIEAMLDSSGMIPMAISVIIFAPLVEELVFRKFIFLVTKNLHIVMSYVISVLTFTLIHVLSSDMSNMKDWLLKCIPYLVSSISFAVIYHKSDKNIYTSLSCHIFNNLIATIFAII